MNKKDRFTYLFLGIIVLLLIFGVSSYKLIKSEGTKCVANPLDFAIEEYSKISPLSCVCGFQDQKFLPFVINQEGKQILKGFEPKTPEMPLGIDIKYP